MRRTDLASLAAVFGGTLAACSCALAQETSAAPSSGDGFLLIAGLFALGLLLLLAEIFLIPGFGITGITGLLLIGASCWQSFVTYGYRTGALISLGLVVLSAAVGFASLKILFVSRAGKSFVHTAAIHGKGTPDEQILDPDLWIARRGTAKTALRPMGKASFDDEILEVTAEEAYVEQGAAIEVYRIENNRPVVRKVTT